MENKKNLTREEIDGYLKDLDSWSVKELEEGSEKRAICKDFKFDNFLSALSFVNLIASSLEELNHHPDIAWGYNKIEFSLTSHSEDNKLTQMDFLTAKRLDEKYGEYQKKYNKRED